MTAPVVEVWWATRSDAGPGWVDVLDDVERARLGEYRRPGDRDRFLVGAALVRVLAARHTGTDPRTVSVDRTCLRCGKPHGRPVPADGSLHLSVSHAGDCVVVAAAPVPVGIDVEAVVAGDVVERLRGQTLAADERARDAVEFTELWTRKEAAVKCTGDGMQVELRDVRVSASGDTPALISYPGRPELPALVRFAALRGTPGGYLASLAVQHPRPTLTQEHDGGVLLREADRPVRPDGAQQS